MCFSVNDIGAVFLHSKTHSGDDTAVHSLIQPALNHIDAVDDNYLHINVM
jgi:hypothetical protein